MKNSLEQVKKLVSERIWKKQENKNLLSIIEKDRLDIEPVCLYGLDRLGLNSLEIINLVPCIGKRFKDMTTADIDHLNYLENKYNCIFNFEEKESYSSGETKTHPMLTKLDGYVSDHNGAHWLRSSALLKLNY